MITCRHVGRRVRDSTGRTGILCDVIADYEDPAELPGERRKQPMAFLRPERGGREWLVPPDTVLPVTLYGRVSATPL
ncbi:hypothetical protein ADL06_04810 [Streptomyces sp. NRRL F-6491]|nr:hypothetical protein ADL06_04810 [Streptomyces sp. NRRL F-6491]KOX51323.1 hypothetical protein ADL08_04505 [Streptomyces sp. NRRL F-6492]